jgi:hypothetical protein
MNFRHYLSIASCCISLFGISCSEQRIEPDKNDYSSLNDYYNSKKPAEQEFTITKDGTDPIVGNQNSRIWINKQVLMYPNGDSVQWPFTLKLVELYKPKDMIYYQMPNLAARYLLTTAGEIRLRAFKDNKELVLRPNRTFPIEMPASSPTSDKGVYYGNESGSVVDWSNNFTAMGVNSIADSLFTATTYGYKAQIGKLGWINAGKLVTDKHECTLSFTSEKDNLKNVDIFIYFPDKRSLMQVYNAKSGLMPAGSSVKIIALAINASGNLYYYYSEQTINASANIAITLEATTDEALTRLLDNL